MPPRSTRRKRTAPPVPTAPVAPSPGSKKPRRSPQSSSVPKKGKAPGEVKPQIPDTRSPGLSYIPNRQTLFLADDHRTTSWQPTQSPKKGSVNVVRYLRPIDNHIHSYFTSPIAAQNAAVTVGPLSIYRHIGHVTLRKFQQLEGLSAENEWFPSVKASKDDYINLAVPITACWCDNQSIIPSLQSLSSVQKDPWPAPYIVLIANRQDVIRACDLEVYRNDFDLDVQIYIGRLLFELIACHDIRQLFDQLVPPLHFAPVAQMPTHPVVFPRSPPLRTPNNMITELLRKGESTGYPSLTPAQTAKIADVLNINLYPYQEQTVRWMLDKENDSPTLNDYFWEERSFTDSPHAPGGKYYYFPMIGEVRLSRPPRTRGGIVAEEMGLGKTVEALALIAAQKTTYQSVEMNIWCEERPTDVRMAGNLIQLTRLRIRNEERFYRESSDLQHGDEVLDDPDEIEFPGNVRVTRWPAKTTLVVCPNALIGQWRQEVLKRTPSLSLAIWDFDAKDSDSKKATIAVGEHAKDIVLATYDMVRNDNTLSKICWKRLILDEAQVTRRSAAQVAKDVFNLRTENRFLMTGTPIVNCLSDLKGQLAILKVWPFALEEDGFWERFFSFPHMVGCEPTLLPMLLNVTMMRHSKGQRLNVSLPQRTYETIKVNITGSYRACYYYVLASCLEELESQSQVQVDTRRLRTLLKLLLVLCLSPFLLNVVSLDLVRRVTWSRRRIASTLAVRSHIQKVAPQEAIEFVAESSGGVVRDSHRSFAIDNAGSSNQLATFLQMPTEELRMLVTNRGLLTIKNPDRVGRDRLAALAAGGVHRLDSDTIADLRKTAGELGLGTSKEVEAWSRAKVRARLQLHYELETGVQPLRTVHESGFSAIMKLMEKKENPSCPVCLMECDGRITVTKCGHLYCLDCMMLLLTGTPEIVRCAICRRDLTPEQTVEISRDKHGTTISTEEEKKVTALLTRGFVSAAAAAQIECVADNVNGGAGVDSGESIEEIQPNCEGEGISSGRPTAAQAWQLFENAGDAPEMFNSIGRSEHFPSLCPEFLRHLAAARSEQTVRPKLAALLNLIRSSDESVKFCVVGGSMNSLRVIAMFLEKQGVECVGAGVQQGSSSRSRAMGEATERFSTDPNVRVYLLNPTNAAGLTLTAASVVVFMETLMRVADEIQAAARVHRIGQTKNVRIIRIVARNSLEEQIVERRGEICNSDEELEALATVTNHEASDQLILQLLTGLSY